MLRPRSASGASRPLRRIPAIAAFLHSASHSERLFLLRVFGCLPDTGVSERTEAGVRKASGEESAGELSLAVVSGYGDLAPEFDLIGGL